jgi:hypothetical protein
MLDRLWKNQQCQYCKEKNPRARTYMLESDHGLICGTCRRPQGRKDDFFYLDDTVSEILWNLLEGEFQIVDRTAEIEDTGGSTALVWCVKTKRSDGVGCSVRQFHSRGLFRPYKGYRYSVGGLGKAVPESVRKIAALLTSDQRQFILTERMLKGSSKRIVLEHKIQTRDDHWPLCEVTRVELCWR